MEKKMKRLVLVTITLLMTATVFTSCDDLYGPTSELNQGSGGGGGGPDNPGGGGGATPGGSQDFTYIRDLIDDGRVPQADNFLVEGIYSRI